MSATARDLACRAMADAHQGFGSAPAYDRLLVLQRGGGDCLGRLALHARHVSDSGADVGVGVLDKSGEDAALGAAP